MISEFAKEKVFWTRKMNLKLVKFIENRPNIWNPKHPKYTNVEYRDQTYAEFAEKYGNEFTGQAVKDRWTNIRSTFANYLRKVKASRVKNDGEIYKVNWHLWDACSFLRKVNKKNNLPTISEYPADEVKQTTFDTEQLNNDISCQNIANGILNVFRGVQNNVLNVDESKYGTLGHILTYSLSQMNSYEAAQLTSKVMKILLLYNEDNPVNPNNLKSEDNPISLISEGS